MITSVPCAPAATVRLPEVALNEEPGLTMVYEMEASNLLEELGAIARALTVCEEVSVIRPW